MDSNVFNFWQVVMNQKEELAYYLKNMPTDIDLLDFKPINEEGNAVKKAFNFLLLSNFKYLKMGKILKLRGNNLQKVILSQLDETRKKLYNCEPENLDFRKFLAPMLFRKTNAFIYCDTSYINVKNNYNNSFSEQDFIDLLNRLPEIGCKYAISEFDSEFVVSQVKQRNLFITNIGERKYSENRKNEILITNYKI